MRSEPVDVPEDTGLRWRMALTQPIQVRSGYTGEKVGEWGPIATVCEFEWTGKTYSYGPGDNARIYVLRDITKTL